MFCTCSHLTAEKFVDIVEPVGTVSSKIPVI